MEDDDEKPEVLMAYREGKARGLPDGWTCSIDVRKKTQYLPGYTARLGYSRYSLETQSTQVESAKWSMLRQHT